MIHRVDLEPSLVVIERRLLLFGDHGDKTQKTKTDVYNCVLRQQTQKHFLEGKQAGWENECISLTVG